MKPSKYNYYISQETGKLLIFNGRTKRFFEVSSQNANAFKDILGHPSGDNFEKYKAFLIRMRNEGFVLDDEVDEQALMEDLYERMRAPHSYMLLVYTTFQCNLRCWYCIQKHQDTYMSKEVAEKVKLHISKYLIKNHIHDFHLSWFGGEPLLAYDIIVEVTKFAKDFCEKNKIRFTSGITSNGLLLTEERIKVFRSLDLTAFQITIDGDRNLHNKVKRLEGESAFDITLNNVKSVLEIMPESNCNLRINYTDKVDVDKVMKEVNEIIPHNLHGHLRITPRKVWQIAEEKIPKDTEEKFRSTIKRDDFLVDCQSMGLCYVANRHFYTIFPDGSVTKCDNDDIKEAQGFLDDKGNIVLSMNNLLEKFSLMGEHSECANCKYLPICWGPCPKTIEQMLQTSGKVSCYHKDLDRHIHRYIEDYVSNFKE